MKIIFIAPLERPLRPLALAMPRTLEIEIIATCAADSGTWSDVDDPYLSWLGTIAIRRFRVDHPRVPELVTRLERAMGTAAAGEDLERRWIWESGPNSWLLLDYLAHLSPTIDAAVFFGLNAATTILGLPLLGERAILVPQIDALPGGSPLRPSLHRVAAQAAAILCSSEAERCVLGSRLAPRLGTRVGPLEQRLPELLEQFRSSAEVAGFGRSVAESGIAGPDKSNV